MPLTRNSKLETRNLQAIIFDFDGTLAKLNIDFSMMRNSVMELLLSYGANLDGLRSLFVLEMIEAGKEILDIDMPANGEDFYRRASNLIRDIEVEGAKRGKLVKGIKEMLLELKARRIKVGIATRNCSEAVMAVFPDISSFCHTVVTRESTRSVKPHPEHVMTVLRNLEAKAVTSAMVGDHPMDIRVGKEAGTFTVGVLTGYSGADALSQAGADLIIESAADIIHHLP
jgi:phosphoglycolate phosphatase